MSEGRNVSNNEQLKSLRWEYAWYVGEAEEKTHGQFESSKEWRELGEIKVPEGTVYESAKLGLNWKSFEEPKEGLNMTYSMEWLVTKSSLCFYVGKKILRNKTWRTSGNQLNNIVFGFMCKLYHLVAK